MATVYAALDREALSDAVPTILLAGCWEGLCLGGAQAAVLRSSGIVVWRWIAVTVAGAAIGYGLSLLGGTGGNAAETGQAEPPVALVMLLGAAMGLFMGAVMGALQAFASKGALSMRWWIVWNMVGWAPAMAIIMAAASLVSRSMTLPTIAAVGALSGGLAGLVLGAVTQRGLPQFR